eukprot:363986-Chlamydomonas_euryale.AAC.21
MHIHFVTKSTHPVLATGVAGYEAQPAVHTSIPPRPSLSFHQPSAQFLRILRSLPYGNSIFFTVRRIEDPIGLLPAKLILGVNKRGVHFFRYGAGVCGWGRQHV